MTPLETDPDPAPGHAWFGGLQLARPVECVDLSDPGALAGGGVWVVVAEFDGPWRAWRFADVARTGSATAAAPRTTGTWRGPREPWATSLDRTAYLAGVQAVRALIRAGEVYQVNLCRVLTAPLEARDRGGDAGAPWGEPDAAALAARLLAGNPAPYAGGVHVPATSGLPPVWAVTASPELFLRVEGGVATSGPIKGTAPLPGGLTAKDAAENVMIADMVRNDLQRVCVPGTVEVTDLLRVEPHPGLVHLVTTVAGALRPGVGWAELLGATFPPASVSGAPRSTALRTITALEPVPRGPYCGAVGWVDADAGRAELAVGIRTFWWDAAGAVLSFGTGAGITWDSDPAAEWAETELKAARLLALAATA